MRLIDADELKRDLICFYPEGVPSGLDSETMFKQILHDIDNAPTVDTDEIYKKGYHNGFFATHDVPPTVEPTYISDMPDDKVKDLQELAIDYGEGIAVFERKRPQGKWIEVTKGIDSNTYKCPFCGRLINCDKPRLKLYPFCHCGADMRGEKK